MPDPCNFSIHQKQPLLSCAMKRIPVRAARSSDYCAAISPVATRVARPRMGAAMLKPRNAGVPSAGAPMSSTSRAWTVALTYRPAAYNPSGEGWYNSHPLCAEKTIDQDCDEYPFRATEQGGETAVPFPASSPSTICTTRTRAATTPPY